MARREEAFWRRAAFCVATPSTTADMTLFPNTGFGPQVFSYQFPVDEEGKFLCFFFAPLIRKVLYRSQILLLYALQTRIK